MTPRSLVSPLITVVDDALPPRVLRELSAAIARVGASASYWKTFWYPLERPENAVERAIDALAARVSDDRLVGTEWWIGRMDTRRVPLDFHHDRDLALFERTGRLAHPAWSSVLYLTTPVGGRLAVTDQRLARRRGALVLDPVEPRRFETVRAESNRFVRFDGRLFHGVLDANDAVPTRPVRGLQGDFVRTSVVVNWWTRRPEDRRRWSGTRRYRALADP